MIINRNNYEIYFLDWHEGNLDPSCEVELRLFLEQNPDLRDEFEEYENIQLIPDTSIHFKDKQLFKKNPVISVGKINISNYHEFFIGSIEGDLKKADSTLLKRFLDRNPTLVRDFNLLKKTVLIPDREIVFDNKSDLKKSISAVYFRKNWFYYASAVAATLLILIWISISNVNSTDQGITQELTTKETQVTSEPTDIEQTISEQSIETVLEQTPVEVSDLTDDQSETFDYVTFVDNIQDNKTEEIIIEKPGFEQRTELIKMPGIHETAEFNIVIADKTNTSRIPDMERNLYSQFFEYIATAEKYALASNQPQSSDEDSEFEVKGFKKLNGLFSRNRKNQSGKKSRINFWTFADIGIYGFNQITNNDLSIDRIKDNDGNVVAYALLNNDEQVSKMRRKKNTVEQLRID